MSPIRKLAIRYTLRLLLGIGMLVLMWEIDGHIAFIAGIAGALLAFWNLVLLTSLAEANAALNYPEYNTPVTFGTRLEKWLHRLSYSFLYATILALSLAGPSLENHIKSNYLLLTYGLLGAVLASIITFVLKRFLPAYFKNNQTRVVAILGLWLSIVVCTALAAGQYNKATARKKLYQQSAYVQHKSKNVSTGSHYLFLRLDNREERFLPKSEEWEKIAEGDSLLLTVGTGSLNYTYIFNFTPNN